MSNVENLLYIPDVYIVVYVYKTQCYIVTYVCYKRVSDNTDGCDLCVCVMDVGMVKEILGTYKIQYHPEEDNLDKVCISIPEDEF